MRSLVRGPWVIGRLRAALLLGVAVAALGDLATFLVVVGADPDAPDPERAGPDVVARQVIQAVADDECADLDLVLADDADLPASVTRCQAGVAGSVALGDVRVEETLTDGDTSAVTVGVVADGVASAVVVDLRREPSGAWLVTGVRPA